jgi:hypothetical protein
MPVVDIKEYMSRVVIVKRTIKRISTRRKSIFRHANHRCIILESFSSRITYDKINDSKENEHVYQGVKLNYQSKENDNTTSVRNESILRTNLDCYSSIKERKQTNR